jgi:hypothetical protein
MDRSRDATRASCPPETRRHLRAAGREQLLAVRSLLDYWIDRMGDTDEAVDRSARTSASTTAPLRAERIATGLRSPAAEART